MSNHRFVAKVLLRALRTSKVQVGQLHFHHAVEIFEVGISNRAPSLRAKPIPRGVFKNKFVDTLMTSGGTAILTFQGLLDYVLAENALEELFSIVARFRDDHVQF